MYPTGSSPQTSTLSANETANLVPQRPPFTVRNRNKINRNIGNAALPSEFVQVPIYSYQRGQNKTSEVIEDDLDLYGCDYVNKIDARFTEDSTYSSVWWLVDDLRKPM